MLALLLFLAGPIDSLKHALEIRSESAINGSAGSGFASPIGAMQALTVDHLVGSGEISWKQESSGKTGTARLAWRDAKKDLAVFHTWEGPPGWDTIPIAGKPPTQLDSIFYCMYIPKQKKVYVKGAVVGVDSDGDLWVDGAAAPGSSGSPVVNQAGELVGFITSGYNPQPGVADFIQSLFSRTSFRPFVIVTPINEFPRAK